MRSRFFLVLVLLLVTSNTTVAQTTVFTYQGKLADNGNPANGHYDFQFKLFDGAGSQHGTTQTVTDFTVTNGIFAVSLDFVNCPTCTPPCANCFDGQPRFLEISVRPTGVGSFAPLSPRQPITSTPYAMKSLNAATADGLSVACLNCVNSSQIASVSGSAVTGTIPVASVPADSANYIQNKTSLQASPSNFNISGNGTASILEATTQFNLAGSRILSNIGSNNLFAGVSAGASNTGSNNSFFGSFAGSNNTGGSSDSFFGRFAGGNNTGGTFNSFFGRNAGLNNTGGSNNTILGAQAGLSNTTEDSNTFIGSFSNGSGGITNATAIGAAARVTQSNSMVLGSINLVNGATADTNVGIGTTGPAERLHVVGNGLFTGNLTVNGTLNATLPTGSGNYIQNTITQQSPGNFNISGNGVIGGKLGVGSAAPGYKLEVIDPGSNGLRVQTNGTGGAVASFGSNGAFNVDAPGTGGGRFTVLENGNVAIGANNPVDKFLVSGIDVVRARINSDANAGIALSLNNQPKWSLATVTGGSLSIYNDAISALALSINSANNNMTVNGTLDAAGYRIGGVGVFNVNGPYNDGFGRPYTGSNIFAGDGAGLNTTPDPSISLPGGKLNSFFGAQAGFTNTTGYANAFFGANAGDANVGGSGNSFFGFGVGFTSINTTGNNNTLLGSHTSLTGGLSNATAIGANASVVQSNSLVLGSSVNVGIGTGAPNARLHIADGFGRILFGNGGCNSGFAGLGFASSLTCTNYSLLGNGTDTIINRPTGGSITFRENNTTQITITPGGNVGIGNPSPGDKLNVNGNVSLLLASGGPTFVCQNSSFQLSTCSSSIRYKKNINPFSSGLSLINRLRPVSFNWKADNQADLGLVAEEVAIVEPLLVTHNAKGEIEGVKYDRVAVVLLNAVREQQVQIKKQAEMIQRQQSELHTQGRLIKQQQSELATLKRVVCKSRPKARKCQ